MHSLREPFYFLGFAAQAIFFIRFFQQWIQSELEKKSSISLFFWQLSIVGNGFLLVHSFIQVQYPMGALQICNLFIAYRNLQSMSCGRVKSFKKISAYIVFALFFYTLAFIIQGIFYLEGKEMFLRLPESPFKNSVTTPHLMWHIVGCFGYVLFSMRFFIQLWQAEKKGVSYFSTAFWVISLIGKCISSLYFIRIADPVNLMSQSLSIIPDMRNLYFSKKGSF
jgi:lipid-A-disaccharide synthase-like uncharacterized protein